MIKRALILLTLLVAAFFPRSAPQGQNEDLPAREDDDRAATTEARQHAATSLLATARQVRDHGELLKAGRLMNRAGRLQLRLDLPRDALATYQDALVLLKQTPDSTVKIDSLNGTAAAYSHLSQCDKASDVLGRAIVLSDQTNNISGKAEALLTQSYCQNYGDHALALRTATDSLALWLSIKDQRGTARAYSAIGDYQLAKNDLLGAAQSHQFALNLWRELKIPYEEAEALINLGFVECRKGAWQDSFAFYAQAAGLLDEKAEPYKMGQITGGIAEAFIESGSPETGLLKSQQALEYFRQAQDPLAMISVSWDVGRAYYLMGNYQEALTTLQRTIGEAEAIHESYVRAMCYEFLGRTYEALNDRVTALRHFQTALDLYTKVAGPMEEARTRALMAQIYEQDGNAGKAHQYYDKALETFQRLSDGVNLSATLYALGRLELKSGNYDVAEKYLWQSIGVTEDLRRISTSRDLTTAFSASAHDRYTSYVDCLMRKHRIQPAQSFDVKAFEMSEQGRGRALVEVLRATQTNLAPGVDPRLAEQEKILRQSLRLKQDQRVSLLGTTYKKEELEALDAELVRFNAEYERVRETIQGRYPSYEQISRPTAWTLRQVQEQIVADDQTVLLEYGLGIDKSYVWAVTHNRIVSYELPAEAVINAAVDGVQRLLTTVPSAETENELTKACQKLAEIVLTPVAGVLDKRRIIVVADGALNYIPFQVLPAPSPNEPLVANYEIINAPSASILGQLRQETGRRQPAEKVLAAFGDPVFASDYPEPQAAKAGEQTAAMQPEEDERWGHALRDIELNGVSFDPSVIKRLRYAKRELAVLRSVASVAETFVAADFDATRERLQGTDLSKFQILHFATHGFLDPKRPENSGLMLSTVSRDGHAVKGFVALQDIYNLHAPVDLVVLSACQTALGKDVRGEGLIGLTRGFMYAGASSVVASLWKVDDEATAELMKQFYTNLLQKGMPPAAALRAAQNSVRQKQEWRAPYYWAAFTLQGEYRHLISPLHAPTTARFRTIIVTGCLLISLAGAAWWYRNRRRRRGIRTAGE